MEFSQLRYFRSVALHSGFTRASQELGLTQPALSRAIAKLEQELGQPLFERQTRKLVLTDAGRTFYERAGQILGLVDDAIAELTDNGHRGKVRIGAIPTIAPYFLPGLLKEFRDQYPDIQVLAFEETTDRLLQRSSQGELDIAILAAPVSSRYLEQEPLFDEDLLAVLPCGHPLAEQPTLSLADLREYPFVLLDETHCLSDTIVSVCRQRAFQPVSVERASQLATVVELVSLGHGVSLVPRMAQSLDSSDRRIYRPVTRPVPVRTILMVTNPDRFQCQRVRNFMEVLRNHVRRQFPGAISKRAGRRTGMVH